MTDASKTILVTGPTGYIGGRLVPRLLDRGHRVRVLARSPQKLRDVPWADQVEIVEGDLSDQESIASACRDIEVLYYLVHSMSGGKKDFMSEEAASARRVANAARQQGVRRIVYLGGLHPEGELSNHLRSRREVGEILLESGIPTIALQAGVVIGSGSASFEMIRHLSDRLPVMTAPRWVRNRIQPIAVRDVLYYLTAAAEVPGDINRTFDIGGPDVLQYGEMMNSYAAVAGLPRRRILVVPVLTPHLAALWVNLISPIPRSLAIPLVESLQYDAVTKESDIRSIIPEPTAGLTSYRDAVRLALVKLREGQVETNWSGASITGAPSDPLPSDPDWSGHNVMTDVRSKRTTSSREALWRVIEGIGGENGWYSLPLAWTVRGWLDKLGGGVGLRRGRRSPERLNAGEALDFWRVEEIERQQFLRLRAEMKLPGRAWLEMKIDEDDDGLVYRQRAVFFPRGLAGQIYWYAILPFHGVIFKGMATKITATAEASR
ncbi:SDR family oxidoreductase [Saxibacter everestensis]|uniref:SDR family oxidoreductase n=1 Tax=Saxibacter everestensis TaxID=2909229 RepID=A0ABY8QU70_9MICO|nr:SDR family oxidoreductase [Brevibacteriaceae bacterium ZFBP1038]